MVTNLVILDEMIKSSSKKYDEMINLLKPPYRHQPKKKKMGWEFNVFLIDLYSIVQFSRCQSQSLPILHGLVQDVKCKQKSTINIHFQVWSIRRVLPLLLLLNSPAYVQSFHTHQGINPRHSSGKIAGLWVSIECLFKSPGLGRYYQ